MRIVPYKKRKKSELCFRIAAFFMITLILLIMLDTLIRPSVKTKVRDCAKTNIVNILDRAILNEAEKGALSYNDMVSITYSVDGRIIALETNNASVNRIKAQFAITVNEALDKVENYEFALCLGTLLGPEILSEYGPEIHFKVKSSSLAQTEIYSTFEDAGINQTVHKIFLSVSANALCYFPGYCTSVSVRTEIPLAETVIIGSVPQTIYGNY